MKKNLLFFYALIMMITACSSPELSKDEAADLIRKEFKYPKPFEYELNLVDPNVARKVSETALDESGLVVVKENWTPSQTAEPKISFSDQGKKFVTGVPADRNEGTAALVKLADIDIAEIGEIKKIDDTHTEVSYTTSFKNVTPFSVLVKRSYTEPDQKTATFTRSEGKWKLDTIH